MTAGHNVPLKLSKATSKNSSPYQIFFNLYKPSTPFKKSAPPPPDFQVVVIKLVFFSYMFCLSFLIGRFSARTTPMPTLQELTDLFDVLPEVPLPPPRQRRQLPGASNVTAAINPVQPPIPEISSQNAQPTLIRRLFPWIFSTAPLANLPPPKRKPNPFVALKTGKKIIVIAVVDASSTSFFRFGQGEFTEWPMV
jgi:tRNA-splicing endonuclease subunit Sen54